MMPAIRDAQGKLTVHDMGAPPVNPPGPIERRQASAQQMADFAAERARMSEHERRGHTSLAEKGKRAREIEAASRARGAQRAGFVKGATKPHQAKPTEEVPMVGGEHSDVGRIREQVEEGHEGNGGHWARKRAAKAEQWFAAIRETSNLTEAAARLGTNAKNVSNFVVQMRASGDLPADIDAKVQSRSVAQRTQPEPVVVEVSLTPSGRVTAAMLEQAGLREPDVAKAAHFMTTERHIEGGEEGAPATAADDLGTTGAAPAEEVATPPSPPRFDMDQDDSQEPPSGTLAAALARAVTPGLVLPCERCAHDAVCSIKPQLVEAIPTIVVASPHPAIHVGVIDCDHFLEVRLA